MHNLQKNYFLEKFILVFYKKFIVLYIHAIYKKECYINNTNIDY